MTQQHMPNGITREQLARHAQREREIAAAHADPLPGPLNDAFASLPQEVAGLRVRHLVHYDFVILKRLNSPLLEILKQGNRKKKVPFTDDQGYEMIYQFTRPCEELADWFDRFTDLAKARVEFRRTARKTIGLTLGPIEVGLLVQCVQREFINSFATVVMYRAKAPPDTQVFPAPPPTETASVGGLNTTAAS